MKITTRGTLCLLFISCLIKTIASRVSYTIFVSNNGDDRNDGSSLDRPIRTLNKARRQAQIAPYRGNSITVEVVGGYYDTLGFTSDDKFFSPLTFRAYNNQEVHITGGQVIPSGLFHAVNDTQIILRLQEAARSKVKQVRLTDAGIIDYGELKDRGYYKQEDAGIELYFNGQPLRLARYPNKGYINVTSVPQGRYGREVGFDDTRATQWVNEVDMWAHGFWYHGWADYGMKVTTVDPYKRTMRVKENGDYGLQTIDSGIEGGYFFVYNALSELDEPGEYFIDRTTGIAYIWPPSDQPEVWLNGTVVASIKSHCVSFYEAANVRLENIILENCRKNGVWGMNVRNITLKNLLIRNTGAGGVYLQGDNRDVLISRCEIYNTTGGVRLEGGDRATLAPSNNVVEHCKIHDVTRLSFSGQHAVDVNGVGSVVRNNELSHLGSSAVFWAGNDHTILENNVFDSCRECSDCGALGSGRDWTYRGNVIRRNYIHGNSRTKRGRSNHGIMLDNQYSSALIESNVLYDNDCGVIIGGGRNNVLRNNVFANTKEMAVMVDKRGLGECGRESNLTLYERLLAVPFENEPWYSRYPDLANILLDPFTPNNPTGNIIMDNIFSQPLEGTVDIYYCPNNLQSLVLEKDNFQGADLRYDFLDPNFGDFRPNKTAFNFLMWNHTAEFPDLPGPLEVGPQFTAGPRIAIKQFPAPTTTGSAFVPAVFPPATHPTIVEMNSGYISRAGCWITTTGCQYSEYVDGEWNRDDWGEENVEAGISEETCMNRAHNIYTYNCQTADAEITALYGPTGANITVGGEGCFVDINFCRTMNTFQTSVRDSWGEVNQNSSGSELLCLHRAREIWRFCGSDTSSVVRAVYRPTGVQRVVGFGCWINVPYCPTGNVPQGTMYDALGASNMDTDKNERECGRRANYYWGLCGKDEKYLVKAIYRPTGLEITAGTGCWMEASYCSRQNTPIKFRDEWGERNAEADTEIGCLLRAKSVYEYCGSDQQSNIMAVYRPTGAYQIIGPGCWLFDNCKNQVQPILDFFRDTYGEHELNAEVNEFACLSRAQEMFDWCGNDQSQLVTAKFSPTGGTFSYP